MTRDDEYKPASRSSPVRRIVAVADRGLAFAALGSEGLARFYGACIEACFWLALGVGIVWLILSTLATITLR